MNRRRLVLCSLTVILVAATSPAVSGSKGGVTPQCLGQDATIVGTAATETIHGTAGPDVIVGGGSDTDTDGDGVLGDEIFGLGGNDLICADPDDRLHTLIHGGGGDDRIRASGDIFGGPGNDTLTAPARREILVNVVGGTGDDVLRSRATEFNIFVPGAGNDTVLGGRGAWNDIWFNAPQGVVVDLRDGTAHGQGDDVFERINIVDGSEHADIIRGDDRWNLLLGWGGDDVLVGRDHRDIVAGGDGDDQVDGGPGNDSVEGNAGHDMLFGRSGNDHLIERRRPEPNLILGGNGTDNCGGGYRVPPNVERGCETHRRAPSVGVRLLGRFPASPI